MAYEFLVWNTPGTYSWPVPANAQPGTIQVWAWGPGGNSASSVSGVGGHSAGGGAGSSIGGEPNLGGLTPGTTVLSITIPSGGSGTDTTVTGGSVTVRGKAGGNAAGVTGGASGGTSTNTVSFAGGAGGNGLSGANKTGGSGGGSAGSTGAGGAGSTTGAGGTAGTGAAGPPSLAGATGAGYGSPAQPGITPGSGAGGPNNNIGAAGANGGNGQVIIIWQTVPGPSMQQATGRPLLGTGHAHGQPGAPIPVPAPPYHPPGTPHRGRPLAQHGQAEGEKGAPAVPFTPGGPPAPFTSPEKAAKGRGRVAAGHGHGEAGVYTQVPAHPVNMWSGTFARTSVFGSSPPALQGVEVPLTPAGQAGPGTGYPTAGNWLFAIVGWNQQQGIPPVTVAVADDVDEWWRPAAPSAATSSTATRTKVEYLPNLPRIPQWVYVGPNGPVDGLSVLVIEVAGLGPWDLVTVTPYSAYAAGATSLPLTLGAPSQQSFLIAAATGDNSNALQGISAGGWQTLPTITAANGTDHTADTVLTSMCVVSSNAASVAATAGTAEDLSGYITAVAITAPNPIPPGHNPNWAYLKYEVGYGSGFQTPPDAITWTDNTKRLLKWHETAGVQYQLGQLQSTNLDTNLRNWDGALTPSNSSSPYYPNVAVGTPFRIRAAVGAPVNRWYVIQKNALKWPEKRNERTLLGYVPAQGTDIWSVTQAPGPSPYRGELYQDLAPAKAWWWPADDQPLAGGVQPTSLRNAAPGNTLPLSITASPNGVNAQDDYGTNGNDISQLSLSYGGTFPPGVAMYQCGASAGWLYGDPQSSGSAQSAEGGPVTDSPGSAAWQSSGVLGNSGAHAWFLVVNDPTFPDAGTAAGCTVEGWFNPAFFFGSQSFNGPLGGIGGGNYFNVCTQPYAPVTLLSLATDTSPVATLQLDLNGHLTFSLAGGSPAVVYNSSDLRCGSWFYVAFSLSSAGYTVYLNAGVTAKAASLSVASPSNWTWLTANGDFGSGGGANLANIQHSGNLLVSHVAVYPRVLPQHRIISHYTAGFTGFGVIPPPSSVQLSQIANAAPTGFTADGSTYQGSYGWVSNTTITNFVFSLVAAAVAGGYTSGPSARATIAGRGMQANPKLGQAIWAGWDTIAPLTQLYTAAAADAETEAASALGSGDAFTSGYGAATTGTGVCQVAGGTGASPPTAPTPLGDTLQQRILRILYYAGITYPLRAIDPDADLVQAALDIGGQQASQGIDNMRSSGSGLLTVGNTGALRYRMRGHMATDTVAWQLSSNSTPGTIPYLADQSWDTDPQRVFNSIRVKPYSPDGSNLPDRTPSNWTGVQASQQQYGPKPLDITSYLQSATEQQAQADWLFLEYGIQRRRCAVITVDAAPLSPVTYPQAWPFVLGVSIGDLVQITDLFIGQSVTAGIYRVTQITRDLSFGADGTPVQAKVTCICDYEPSSYWT